MDPLTLSLIAAAGLILTKKPDASRAPMSDGIRPLSSLPDCKPENQSGSYSRTFDEVYYFFSQRFGIPFCLIKAHAIRESLQDQRAYRQEPNGKASYGLMQILWWKNSNRFKSWGYSDDAIGDGSLLYDAWVNVEIACQIIKDNFRVHGNLRDAVNSYNTGRNEATRPAPGNYVNDVLKTYEKILGRPI